MGATGFIFWWTKDFDFKTENIIASVFYSIAGPTTWIMGYFIHGNKGDSKVLIRKRLI
jgi:hypothetical protein